MPPHIGPRKFFDFLLLKSFSSFEHENDGPPAKSTQSRKLDSVSSENSGIYSCGVWIQLGKISSTTMLSTNMISVKTGHMEFTCNKQYVIDRVMYVDVKASFWDYFK